MTAALPQIDWRDAAGVKHHGPALAAANGFDVIDCAACGFRHALPLPSAEELREVYAHDYYQAEKPLYIARYLEDRDWWQVVYAERLQRLEAELPADRRRLLDVGSGPGLFLAAARERGWQVRGIEPSSQAAHYSREQLGLDITERFLDTDLAQELSRFDALNLGEVLEHLPDPAALLRLSHGLLDDGGQLCLVVPNDFNPIQQHLQQHEGVAPWWVAPPHHLNYFDPASLRRLVERCGFAVSHVETTFPIDLLLLMGHHYIGNDTLGRQAHAMRKRLELSLARATDGRLKAALYGAFAQCGLGREIVLFARKS